MPPCVSAPEPLLVATQVEAPERVREHPARPHPDARPARSGRSFQVEAVGIARVHRLRRAVGRFARVNAPQATRASCSGPSSRSVSTSQARCTARPSAARHRTDPPPPHDLEQGQVDVRSRARRRLKEGLGAQGTGVPGINPVKPLRVRRGTTPGYPRGRARTAPRVRDERWACRSLLVATRPDAPECTGPATEEDSGSAAARALTARWSCLGSRDGQVGPSGHRSRGHEGRTRMTTGPARPSTGLRAVEGHDAWGTISRDWQEWSRHRLVGPRLTSRRGRTASGFRRTKASSGRRRARSLRHLIAAAVIRTTRMIAALDGLERLELEWPVTASDLAPLRRLTRLRFLSIDSPGGTSRTSPPCSSLPSLRSLLVENAKHLSDADWLADGDHLEVIGLEGGMWTRSGSRASGRSAGCDRLRGLLLHRCDCATRTSRPSRTVRRLELLSCARFAPPARFEGCTGAGRFPVRLVDPGGCGPIRAPWAARDPVAEPCDRVSRRVVDEAVVACG